MPDNEMQIRLMVDDQATKKGKEAIDGLKKAGDEAAKKSSENAKNKEKYDKEDERRAIKLTLTVGGLIKAYNLMTKSIGDIVKVGREMDSGFNASFNKFEISVLKVQQAIAQKLIPPLKTALDFWTELLNKGGGDSSGFIGDLKKAEENLQRLQISLKNIGSGNFVKNRFNLDKVNQEKAAIEAQINMQERLIETLKKQAKVQEERSEFNENIKILQARQALEEYNKELKNNELLFITGKESATQYYQNLIELQNQSIAVNQQAAKQLNELALLTTQVNNTEILEAQRKTSEQISLLNFYKETYTTAHQGMAALTVTVGKSIQTNLSGALTDMITGAKSAKEAFTDFGRAMIQTIVQFMAQKLVAAILEKTLLSGTVAASTAAGAAIAAAWAPAAAFVSLATLGANSVPAAAGVASVNALTLAFAAAGAAASQGVQFGGARARGGDEVVSRPTLFLAGEAGPERATFTPLGGGSSGGGGMGNITIIIQNAIMDSAQGIAQTAEELGFAVERSLRTGRGI